jgi:geranylgeranyl diphosphate synthase, type II
MKAFDKTLVNTNYLLAQFENYLENEAFAGFPEVLYESARHIMQIKGKRIRPLLLLTACKVFDGKISDALGPASAVEIFHNFSLVHDDIIDKADIRRGQPSVHKVYGLNKAILTGDAMLLHSFIQLSKGPADQLKELLRVFNKATSEVIEGEQYDVNFETIPEISEDDYMKMIEYKTSVLLAASVQLGAIVGGAPAIDQKHIYNFGLNLGLAFQIKDDYLDSYSDGEKFGKRIGGDIVQNKKTFLLITALKNANQEQRKNIFNLFKERNESMKIEKMLSMFDQLSVKEQTFAKMEDLYTQSLASLNALSIAESDRRLLLELAEMVYHRDY